MCPMTKGGKKQKRVLEVFRSEISSSGLEWVLLAPSPLNLAVLGG
jgi:hypothetical protein